MRPRKSSLATALRTGLIITTISLLLLEMAGVASYYYSRSEWFYSRTKEHPATPVDNQAAPLSKAVLHPYLGFIRRPGTPMSRVAPDARLNRMLPGVSDLPAWTRMVSNNHGFFANQDYPVSRQSGGEYLIGVFGGSVAQWFALQGAAELTNRLRETPEFRNRPVRILNFAQSGHKQPQQLQTLSYFLTLGQPLDLVLNIDGFNELALGNLNTQQGVDANLPSAQHLLPLLQLLDSGPNSAAQADRLHDIVTAQHRLSELDTRRENTVSAAVYLITVQLTTLLENRLSLLKFEYGQYTDPGKHDLYPLSYPNSGNKPFDLFDTWSGAARVMQNLARSSGIDYLELIQPNQYASAKPMSTREQEIALRRNSPYRAAIEAYYPKISEWVDTQRATGLNIHDTSEIFDSTDATVYSDDCCHYNQLGNEILARAAADLILQTISNRSAE